MRSFVAGLAVGCGIGVLFAPMTGAELRNSISDRGRALADDARNKINAATDATNTTTQAEAR